MSKMHFPNQPDEVDFQEFVVRNLDFVRRLTVGMLGPSQMVNDLVQEVFLRALRAYGSFRGDANVRTWIYRITAHVIYDHLDKQKKQTKYHNHETTLDTLADHA